MATPTKAQQRALRRRTRHMGSTLPPMLLVVADVTPAGDWDVTIEDRLLSAADIALALRHIADMLDRGEIPG